MLSLDLFNTKYERELQEGAVDDLEARRIDILNDRMQDLLGRAKEPNYKNNPAALAGLKREFQKVKDERDSYYKVREGSVTPTATGLRHQANPGTYGGYEPEADPLARLDKKSVNRADKAMGVKFDREKKYQGGLDVDEAGIPGNVPTEKIPGKEDLLKGKGRSYYEDQKKNSEAVSEHGGGIGPRQHWQELMPEQTNPEDDDWYDDEENQETELRSGDYVRDTQDGEYGEVFRMQGDPYERRVRILDRDGRGWYIEPSRLTRVDPTDPDVQRYFGKQRQRDMDEAIVASGPSQPLDDRAVRKLVWDTMKINADSGDQAIQRALAVLAKKPQSRMVQDLQDKFQSLADRLSQGVAEARRVKGGDYQLKLVDKQSDDDTDLDDVVMDYYFDVYQNGQKIGTAEGDSYYGELVVKPEFDRQFKLSSFHDKDHPLMQQFEKIENGVAESATAPIIVPKRKKKAKPEPKFHIPYSASDYVPPAVQIARDEAAKKKNVKEAGVSDETVKQLQGLFKQAKAGKLKSDGKDFTKGDHWQGAKPGDYGYTGYQGHGMPKDNPKKKKGVAEGENQEYTVRVVDEEGSGYTVKVTATSEQGALHKAIVKVRNSGARPEHARIIRQGVAEGIDHPYDRGLEDGLAGKEYNDSMYSSYEDKESYRRGRIVAKQQVKKGVAEADETSWTANSAQFRKEEDMSWPVEITLEPNADINQGRGRQVKTMTVTGQSRDAAKKKLVDYFLKNGWTVTGIKFTGDLDEQDVAEGWSDAVVARRTGQPRTPYSVYINGKKWKDFENDDHAEAVANKLRAKFKADGRDPETVTIAPTDYDQPIKEEQDTSGVESAIIRRIMVAHTDLLKQFGPDKVMQAAEEVAYNVGDVDEIGTSDVSAYVAQVKQILGATA
jgi:hypothetical protein